MLQSRLYTCEFCFKEYVPTRRGAQKFCSDSCRSKAHFHKKKKIDNGKGRNTTTVVAQEKNKTVPKYPSEKTSIEKVSVPGVANAAVGTLAANALLSAFIKTENKPATKGDVKKIISEIKGRYHLVQNMLLTADGKKPYFDMETNMVVFI